MPFYRHLYDGPPADSGPLNIAPDPDPGRHVRFEFAGGFRDGRVFEGPLADPFHWKSGYGKVGTRFSMPTEAAIDAMIRGEPTGPILDQEYEVAENRLEGEVRHVRAESRRGGAGPR